MGKVFAITKPVNELISRIKAGIKQAFSFTSRLAKIRKQNWIMPNHVWDVAK